MTFKPYRKQKKAAEGMTKRDAMDLRMKGVGVNGCYRCLQLSLPKNQWRDRDLHFVGEKALCPQHYKEAMESDMN